MLRYAVITRAGGNGGNLAVRGDVMVQTAPPDDANDYLGTHRPAFEVMGIGAIALRVPVFTLGEVVILDGDHGREVDGDQRKPGKWDVDTESFETIEAAVERALAVRREAEEAASAGDAQPVTA